MPRIHLLHLKISPHTTFQFFTHLVPQKPSMGNVPKQADDRVDTAKNEIGARGAGDAHRTDCDSRVETYGQ